jgi:phage terminase large subunit-like protein
MKMDTSQIFNKNSLNKFEQARQKHKPAKIEYLVNAEMPPKMI